MDKALVISPMPHPGQAMAALRGEPTQFPEEGADLGPVGG